MTTVGQLAAVRRAPRFKRCLRSKSVPLIVFCENGDTLSSETAASSLRRLPHVVRWGLAMAGLAAAGGWALERARLGGTDAEALSRIEAEVRARFDRSAATLAALSARVQTDREAIAAAPRDPAAAKRLF